MGARRDRGIGQLGMVLVMAVIGVAASLAALLLWRLVLRSAVGL